MSEISNDKEIDLMSEFKAGDLVSVTYKGRIHYFNKTKSEYWVIPEGISFSNLVLADSITRLDPDNWPPQLGDIWEAEGEEYVAIDSSLDESPVLFNVDNYGSDYHIRTHEAFKKKNPILVRRRNVPMA